MKIAGNAQDALRLRQELFECFRAMNQNIGSFNSFLGKVKVSWKDEEYGKVRQILEDMMRLTIRYMDDVAEVLNVLDEYAGLLEKKAEEKRQGEIIPYPAPEKPRELPFTGQQWREENGDRIFDSPLETRENMDLDQGKARGFSGTCGLVSCANVLRLAGVNVREEDIVSCAAALGLCNKGSVFSSQNGATSAQDRQQLLGHYGLQTDLCACDIDSIARYVEEGKGVIISVHAYRLWYNRKSARDFHAVTVTSVKRGKDGSILGFYIADSGRHGKDGEGYYPAKKLKKALTGRQMNVTRSAIR